MHIKINKADLAGILANIQGITAKKTNIAVSEHVLIQAHETHLTFCATDFQTGFIGQYPAEIISPGLILPNSKKLYEIVRDFPQETVEIERVENNWLQIGKESATFHILSLNPDDFPEIPEMDDVDLFEMDALFLKRMIQKTVYIGAAADEKRAHIVGVMLECTPDDETGHRLRLVSTDSRRLSKIDYRTEQNPAAFPAKSILIPKKSLAEVAKFLSLSGKAGLGVKRNNLIVQKDHESFIINLLEGEFPDYKRALSFMDAQFIVEVNRLDFLNMMRRVSILTTDNYKSVIFDFEDDRFVVSIANPELGEFREEMRISYQRPPIKLAFNPRYFIETLHLIEEDRICLYVVDEEKPCLLHGIDDPNFLSVVMSMKINPT